MSFTKPDTGGKARIPLLDLTLKSLGVSMDSTDTPESKVSSTNNSPHGSDGAIATNTKTSEDIEVVVDPQSPMAPPLPPMSNNIDFPSSGTVSHGPSVSAPVTKREKRGFNDGPLQLSAKSRAYLVQPATLALASAIIGLITITIALIVMGADGDKPSADTVPYISDGGSFDPERIIFTAGLIPCVLLLLQTVLNVSCLIELKLQHLHRLLMDSKQSQTAIAERMREVMRWRGVHMVRWNSVANTCGAIACLGLFLTAAISWAVLPSVHLIGAFIFFISGNIWMGLHTALLQRCHIFLSSAKMYPNSSPRQSRRSDTWEAPEKLGFFQSLHAAAISSRNYPRVVRLKWICVWVVAVGVLAIIVIAGFTDGGNDPPGPIVLPVIEFIITFAALVFISSLYVDLHECRNQLRA